MSNEIYLLLHEGDEGSHVWCDHVPNDDMDVVKYHHDRVVTALKERNARLTEQVSSLETKVSSLVEALDLALRHVPRLIATKGSIGIDGWFENVDYKNIKQALAENKNFEREVCKTVLNEVKERKE
jgi:hypothetical protein